MPCRRSIAGSGHGLHENLLKIMVFFGIPGQIRARNNWNTQGPSGWGSETGPTTKKSPHALTVPVSQSIHGLCRQGLE